jgi:uncharacterized protein (DUF1330 family)
MTRTVDPRGEDLRRLATEVPQNVPVVMLNLLKFREAAAYPPGHGEVGCSGRAAYATYSRLIVPMLRRAEGTPLWRAQARSAFIAPAGEEWDDVLLVRYPSIEAFIGMVTSPDYQAITVHRSAALQDSRLIATTPDLPGAPTLPDA